MASQRSSATSRRHPTIGAAGRLLAVAALTFGWLLSAAPAGAQSADGLDGDTYTDGQYAWSVQFDDRVWEAEEAESDPEASLDFVGVQLSADAAFATLYVYDDGIEDAADCLADIERFYESSNAWESVAPARRLDLPATDRAAEADLYTGTLLADDGDIDAALYLECRAVEGATLTVVVTILETSYQDVLPDLEDLLAGIETGGGSSNGPNPNGPVTRRGDTPTPEEDTPSEEADTPASEADTPASEAETPTDETQLTPESDPTSFDHEPGDQLGARDDGALEDGSYVAEVGYALTWDADVYEGQTGDDPGAGVLLENAESGATVELAAFEDAAIEDCIAAEVQRILQSPDYLSAAASNGVRPPTSDDEAVGRMLRATEDSMQQPRKLIYVECRPLLDEGDGGDPVFLVVRAASDDEDFRASRAEFEAILAAITIGDAPAPTPTAQAEAAPTRKSTREATQESEPTPKPRRTPTVEPDQPAGLGETDIANGAFVGVRVPFKVEWDTAYWDVEEVTDQGIEGISVTSDQGAFGSILSLNTPPDYDMETCLTAFIDGWAELTPDLGQIEPEADAQLALPEGSGSVYGAGTFSFDDGTTATLIHGGGCLELDGGGFLVVQMQIFEPVYAENLAAFNEVLGSIEFGSADQVGAMTPAGAAPLAGSHVDRPIGRPVE